MKKLLLFLLLIPFFGNSQTKRYKSGDWTYVERIKKEGDAFDGFTTSAVRYAYVCNDNTCIFIQDYDITDDSSQVQMYIKDNANSTSTPIKNALSDFYSIEEDWEKYKNRRIIDKTRDLINGKSDSRFDDKSENWLKFSIRRVYDDITSPFNFSRSSRAVKYRLKERYKKEVENNDEPAIFLSEDIQVTYIFKGNFYSRSELNDLSESSAMSIDEILSIASKPRRMYRNLQKYSSVSFRFGHSLNDNLTTQTFSLNGSTKAIRFVLGL